MSTGISAARRDEALDADQLADVFCARVDAPRRAPATTRAYNERNYRAIMLQTTTSMLQTACGEASRLDIGKCATRADLWNLGKKHGSRCGLITFADTATVLARRQFPTSWTLHLTVDSVACQGAPTAANLDAALDAAADLLDDVPESVRAQIHVVGDGLVTFDADRLEVLAEELSELNAAVVFNLIADVAPPQLLGAVAIMHRRVPVKIMPVAELEWALTALRVATERAVGGEVAILPDYVRRVFAPPAGRVSTMSPSMPLESTQLADPIPSHAAVV